MKKRLISIIVPVHNERGNIAALYRAVCRQMELLGRGFDYQFIFIDDGSTDGSLAVIAALAKRDQRVAYLELSRNFGKEMATTAGLHYATGDAALIIDADLQHPPDLIPSFIARWLEGADVVIGVRQRRQGIGLLKWFGGGFFEAVMNVISETDLTAHGTDFRLLDRRVINEFARFSEHQRLTRGLLDWLGFRRAYIPFVASPRLTGIPSYKKIGLFKLAINAFVAHSLFPLKFAGYLGVVITFLSGLFGLFIIINTYVLDDPFSFNFSGSASLAVFNSFLIGIVLSCLGLIAMYIGTIQAETMNRPLYVVRSAKRLTSHK